jgi:hypothetical protein
MTLKNNSPESWTVLLSTGDVVHWDGLTMATKLNRHMLTTDDGQLVNPEQVVTLTPPTAGGAV